ncbi:MAG: DUF952 domain-containing protein [Acidimicrobiia bacterium]|nr:DUF952 domain-containing protein [Acidimicrobiia bacterium]MYF83222.1 DUF952 domain-containing protein [Acidimicrobiia bacterium]
MAEVCKIMTPEEWEESIAAGKAYVAVSEADLRDGYLHCSSADQVPGTLAKWYGAMDSVVVVTVDTAKLDSEVKWEPNAVGELFPHIYGAIGPEAVAGVEKLRRDSTGELMPIGEGV